MVASRAGARHAELAIEGMTCASCAARIEKRLNQLEGVHASVNYASEHAAVAFDPAAGVGRGSDRRRSRRPAITRRCRGRPWARRIRRGRTGTRLVVAAALSVPLALLAMVPALQFSGWEWVSLALATPVVFWAAGRFTAPPC